MKYPAQHRHWNRSTHMFNLRPGAQEPMPAPPMLTREPVPPVRAGTCPQIVPPSHGRCAPAQAYSLYRSDRQSVYSRSKASATFLLARLPFMTFSPFARALFSRRALGHPLFASSTT